jgi:hypothetical protein
MQIYLELRVNNNHNNGALNNKFKEKFIYSQGHMENNFTYH